MDGCSESAGVWLYHRSCDRLKLLEHRVFVQSDYRPRRDDNIAYFRPEIPTPQTDARRTQPTPGARTARASTATFPTPGTPPHPTPVPILNPAMFNGHTPSTAIQLPPAAPSTGGKIQMACSNPNPLGV